MNKYIFSFVIAGLIVITPITSIAETNDNPYMGIQYAIGDVSIDAFSEDSSPTTLIARVGRYFHDNYSIEGRIAFPLQDDARTVSGTSARVGLFGLLGVYGTGHVTFWERYSVYGIAGLSLVKGEVETSINNASDSDFGISYGVGVDIGLGKTAVNIEYISYTDDPSFDFNALGLGLKITF